MGAPLRGAGSSGLAGPPDLSGPAGGALRNDHFESNGACGVVVLGTRNAVSATTVALDHDRSRLNGQAGFYFGRGALGQLTNSLAEHNVQHGVVLSDHGTAPALHRNLCVANGGWGYTFKNGASGTLPPDNSARSNEMGDVGR